MRVTIITICLLFIVGCGPEIDAFWFGVPSGFVSAPPPLYPSFNPWPMRFHSIHGGTFEADGIGDLLRQQEMDDMLWKHQHGGASFPFNEPWR